MEPPFSGMGSILKRESTFASIGLDLCLNPEQIEESLRRSVFSEITEADLRKTIILNAKALIERDADFAKFAARILLTYIYQEVLGWDVSQHSIEEIRTFHAKEFKSYLKRGVAIKRLDKKLLKLI
jgi:ribonucleoside-diphosphate reductase alpha chain